jgi:hypothetical protein
MCDDSNDNYRVCHGAMCKLWRHKRRARFTLPCAIATLFFAAHSAVCLCRHLSGGPSWQRAARLEVAADEADDLPPSFRAKVPDLRFFVIGDWGAPCERPAMEGTQRLVASAMELVSTGGSFPGAQFVLSLGDAFYMNGVESHDDPRIDEVFRRTFAHAPSLSALEWHSVLGNHDCRGNVSALLHAGTRRQRLRQAGRADADSDEEGTLGPGAAYRLPARYWSWRTGLGSRPDGQGSPEEGAPSGAEAQGVRLALLDTCSLVCAPGQEVHEGAALLSDVQAVLAEEQFTPERWRKLLAARAAWPVSPELPLGFNGSLNRQAECTHMRPSSTIPPAAQLGWLQRKLRSASRARDWAIVAGHSPIRSVGTGHGDYPQLLKSIAPVLRKGGASVYFAGDEHSLQHIEDEGLHLFVIGAGGGLNLHPLQAAAAGGRATTRWARSALGFATVHASARELTVTVYTVELADALRAGGGGDRGATAGAQQPEPEVGASAERGSRYVGAVRDDFGTEYAVIAAHQFVLRRDDDS